MKDTYIEEWKQIKEFPSYAVSSLGRVKNIAKGSFIKIITRKGKYNYNSVSLHNKGQIKKVSLHRQVALAFIHNPENKPQVNHINGIKTDNRVENLEWVTISENNLHAYRTGLKPTGENHHKAKLTALQVEEIRRIGKTLTLKQVSKMFNVSTTNIRDIREGVIWKNNSSLV